MRADRCRSGSCASLDCRNRAGAEDRRFASEYFRAAVPDLSVAIRKMVVGNDYVTVHMEFTGHITGSFANARGQGQAVDFIGL
jgi:predicted ester cyclase